MPFSDNDERWIENLRDHFDGEEETKRQLRETSLQEGRYLLEERVGEGAFAVVYRARDRKLSRPVAVKVLREQAAASDVIRKRFLREARSVAQISHPNVVSVHDVGEEGTKMFLVMELVEGKTLQHLFEKKPGEIRDRVELLEQVSRGLAIAHAQGVVHRDVKPANILLTAEGIPKIADFGLAHLRGSQTLLTASGATMGTPAYMAPEQVQGRLREIGPSTDVYALGMVLYEILTGNLAHEGNTPVELYNRIVEEDPVRPRKRNPSAPGELETICLKALSKDRHRRYANATAFADDLRRWLDGEPIEARPASWIYRVRRKVAKRKAIAVSLAVSIVIVAGILALVLPRLQKVEQEKEEILSAQQKSEKAREQARKLVKEGDRTIKIREQWKKTVQIYTRAIEADPEYAIAYARRGLILFQNGKLAASVEDYTEAIRLDPDNDQTYNNRGVSFYKMRDLEAAFADYTRSIGLNPSDASPYNNRGRVRSDQGDLDGAIADYTSAIRLDPEYSEAYLNRGAAKAAKRDPEGAIADLTRSIELNPRSNTAYNNRGIERYKMGNLEGAIEDYTKAIGLDPTIGYSYSNRG